MKRNKVCRACGRVYPSNKNKCPECGEKEFVWFDLTDQQLFVKGEEKTEKRKIIKTPSYPEIKRQGKEHCTKNPLKVSHSISFML